MDHPTRAWGLIFVFSEAPMLTGLFAQYYFGLLAISFIVTAPYMSLSRWEENFLPPLQHKVINPVW